MNKFVGTLTFTWKVDVEKINFKKLVIAWENTTLFLFWETEIDNSEALFQYFGGFWELVNYDISLDTEDNISMLNTIIEPEGVYEMTSFESPEIDIRSISSRFLDSFEVISVREAEESEKFWNRIIKVDFIY